MGWKSIDKISLLSGGFKKGEDYVFDLYRTRPDCCRRAFMVDQHLHSHGGTHKNDPECRRRHLPHLVAAENFRPLERPRPYIFNPLIL
jgi:hypothetical protein